MSTPRRVYRKGSSAWTRLIPKQVLHSEELEPKISKVWKIKPHNSKSLAWRETSTKGQGTIIPKRVKFLREQKEKG